MSMSTIEHRPLLAGTGRFLLPLALLGAAAVVLIATSFTPNDLYAEGGSYLGDDFDQDGLTEAQEIVLGTLPGESDSDGDGYPDLEEIARKSDPLDSSSIPEPSDLDLGMFANVQDGVLVIGIAIYARDGKFSNFEFDLGVVVNGQALIVSPITYSRIILSFVSNSTKAPNDRILVLELPLPESLVHKWGQFSVYGRIEDPAQPTSEPIGDVTNMIVTGGVVARIEDPPARLGGGSLGSGVIYRPLTGGRSLPPSWSSGQVCWQNTSAVGTNGSAIIYEVDQASCEDLDSSCNPSACTASVGTGIELPDPGTILGG